MSPVVEEFRGPATEWDAFVRRSDRGTHCHRIGWRAVIERVFGHECLYLAARNDAGALDGVLPLVRVKSPVFGHFLVSMPFLNAGGPIGTDEAVAALAAHAVTIGDRDRVGLVELRSRAPLPIDLPVSHRKITVLLDLPSSADALWKAFESKLRSQIRRPQKEGVEVRFGADQLAPFFEVFARHMRDLGTPTQSRHFFEAIVDSFPDTTWLGCAYYQGRPVAAGCGFRWGAEFEMTWASSLVEHKRIAPNMLLYWAFMQRAIDDRATVFDFGRCTPDGGTHRFKRQWGTRDEPLWWYAMARSAASTPSPDDGAYSWGPRLWKHLPTPVATALGPRIVKYIP